MLRYLSNFRYRQLNNVFVLIVALLGSSLFAFGTIIAVVYTVFAGVVFGLFAKRKPLLESILPGFIAYFFASVLYLFTPSGMELFPVPVQVTLLLIATGIGGVLTLLGGLISLPFRKLGAREKLLNRLTGTAEVSVTERGFRKQSAKDNSGFSDMLKRLTVLVLFSYVTMQVVLPVLSKVYAAETYTVDEYVEVYDPDKEIKTKGVDKSAPVERNMPQDTTELQQEQVPEKKEKEMTPEERRLEVLKTLNLDLEKLKDMYEKEMISEKEFLLLLQHLQKEGKVKAKDFFSKENLEWLGKNFSKKFPEIAKALEEIKNDWWKPWMWAKLQYQLVAAIDKDVFNGTGARVVQTAVKVVAGAADAVVDGAVSAVKFVVEHPVQAVIMVGATVGIVVAAAVSPFVATALVVLGVVGLVVTGITLAVSFAQDGWDGVMAQLFSEETLAMLAAGDPGAWGRIPVELAGFLLMNWPENPFAAAAAISGLVKAFRAANAMGDIAKLLFDMRALAAMGKNAKALSTAGYEALLAMSKLAAVKGARELDEFAWFIQSAFMNPEMALALSTLNKSGDTAQDLAKISDEAVDGMLLDEMDGLMEMGKLGNRSDDSIGKVLTEVDKEIFDSVASSLNAEDGYRAELFVRRGINVAENNVQVLHSINEFKASAEFRSLSHIDQQKKEVELYGIIGKFQGNEKILNKISPYIEDFDNTQTIQAIAESKNLQFILDIADEFEINGVIRRVKSQGNKSMVEHFSEKALRHIFLGDNKPNGDGSGFHFKATGGENTFIDESTKSRTNTFGAYDAEVFVNGQPKIDNLGRSTFFPDNWDINDVIDAINQAYTDPKLVHINGDQYIGKTTSGMDIILIIRNNEIISAYPKL